MRKTIITRRVGKSGQLHIAETLIASMLLLVLALSIANISINISDEQNNLEWLEKEAWSIIEAADSSGLLKPVIYAEDQDLLVILNDFITSRIPLNYDFSLERTGDSSKTLISAGSVETSNIEVYSIHYYLSGFASLQYGIYNIPYTVTFTLYKIV
ncbi:MAG: hypothetical protein ACTSP4_04575 [Candidatus Hodarchaeales archaeon]